MSAPSADSDRNLLFGVLALQMDFITRDSLVAAMNAWVLEKGKPLGSILRERGLADDEHDLIEAIVAKHLARHGGDPSSSLASLHATPADLAALGEVVDSDVCASLTVLGTDDSQAAGDRTATYLGLPTSAGGRFRVLRLHDRGGLGEVYVARDEELRREVALKQIQDRYADDPGSRARFLVEAEVTGGLEHPGVVPVYGLGVHPDGRPFYAMRLIRGENLRHAADRFHQAEAAGRDPGERLLSLQKLLRKFLGVCDAVGYAHSRGVLHRDLKPGNVMLGPYGETLVVDWGLAKAVDRADESTGESTLRPESGSGMQPTEAGSRVGTPAYMSPEQAQGALDKLGPASDVYGLGATLYYILTGRPPFDDRDQVELLRKVEIGDFPAPRVINPRIEPALDAICRKAMAREPSGRYSSAKALAEDVERYLADEPVAAHHEGKSERLARWARRHRAWVRAGVAAIVLVAFVAGAAAIAVNAARKRADSQRQLADERLLHARSAAAEMAVERGLSLCESDDPARGMLWLAAALELAPTSNVGLQRLIRVNLTGWSRRLFRLSAVLPHRHEVRVAMFSPDGKTILTGDGDRQADDRGAAHLWDAESGQPIGSPMEAQGTIWAAAFSPDSKAVFTSGDHDVRMWDTTTGRSLAPPWVHPGPVLALSLSPDGKVALTGGIEEQQLIGTARFWDVTTGRPLSPPLKHRGWVMGTAFRPDGRVAMTWDGILGEPGGQVRLWDASTWEPIGSPLEHPFTVWSAAFSPDGNTIVTGSGRIEAGSSKYVGEVRLYDLVGKNDRWVVPNGSGHIRAVAFSPDGRFVASGDSSGVVSVCEAADGRLVWLKQGHKESVTSIKFRCDGRYLLTTSFDGTARLWETATGEPLGPSMQHPGNIRAGDFDPAGTRIVTGGSDRASRVWQIAGALPAAPRVTDRSLPPVRSFTVPVSSLTVLWDVTKDQAAHRGTAARLWDPATNRARGPVLVHPYEIMTTAVGPDGRSVTTTCGESQSQRGEIRIWDGITGKLLAAPIERFGPVRSIAYSPDGTMILDAGTGDGMARLTDPKTGQTMVPPLRHPSIVDLVAFMPDGKSLVTASFGTIPLRNGESYRDGRVQFWDTATAHPLGPPRNVTEIVTGLQPGPGDSVLITLQQSGHGPRLEIDPPMAGDPSHVVPWVWSTTGLRLNRGDVEVLDAERWEDATRQSRVRP